MRNPFKRKALTGTPAVVEALSNRTVNFWPSLGGSNRALQQIRAVYSTAQSAGYAWMYANSPAVRTVVDLIARNVAQLDLRLYEEIDESRREARPDHSAALSLRNPSPTMTRDQFVRATIQDYLVYNNAYALKFRNRDQIILKPIPAHKVEILGQELFDPEAYKIHRVDGSFLIIEDPTDVIHWRGWNPNDPRIGLSPLETLRNVVAEDAALQATIVELAKVGLAGPSWVSRPLEAPAWSNEARERFEEDLTNRLSRSDRTPPVLEEGMEIHSNGVSPRDAEMLAVRKWALEQIATLYGVPLGKVGLAPDDEAAQEAFYADTLPPYCEQWTRTLDLGVLTQEYGETEFCFEFNLDEKQMGNERMKTLTSASGRPVLLTNEARAMLNKPPVDGGDELVTPQNVLVGENPKPSTDVMPIQDPNGPEQDGSYREDGKALNGVLGAMATDRTLPRFSGDMNRQHRYIDEVAGKLERYYARQARSLTQKAATKADSDRWNRELSDDLHEAVRSIVEREGNLYVARLAGDEFDIRQVENYLKAMSGGVAEAINRVTDEDIEKLGVKEALARARGERSESAAASIGTRATVFARTEAAKQAPNPELRKKTWLANTDRHANLNGETVPLNATWGGLEPGSAPGCKCSASIS
jgi:HK97 family phage portal protein